jgi:hypothetical protein
MNTLALRSFCLSLLFACVSVLSAQGSTLTLTDQNSTVLINSTSQAGVYQWNVDGVNELAQQWFWYGIGSGTAAAPASIDTLSAPVVSGTSAGGATLTYMGTNGLEVGVTYTLTGAASGSMTSGLGETITITNTSGQSMPLHFYQYSNYQIGGGSTGNTLSFTNTNTVDQYAISGNTETVAETVHTQSHLLGLTVEYQGGAYPTLLNLLNGGNQVTLNSTPPLNTPLGPGNMSWAYEWDVSLAQGAQLIISKDKNITPQPVPEPAAGAVLLALAGACLMLHAGRWRRL